MLVQGPCLVIDLCVTKWFFVLAECAFDLVLFGHVFLLDRHVRVTQ